MKAYPAMLRRCLLGGLLSAALVPGLIALSGVLSGTPALPVTAAMLASFGLRLLPALGLEILLSFAFGASLGAATAPFADDRRTLLRDSLGHLLLSGLLFFLLCALCRFGTGLGESTAFLLGLFVLIYALVWLARWMGWYSDVLAIRDALGLTVPSPLRWRQTLVYAPLLLFLCAVLPVLCRFIDRAAGADVPVFSALVLPFLLLPAGGFCAGLSLGRRAGFCPLFAPAALALYLPAVYLVFNPSALFQAFILFFAALLGTLLGAALRRNKRKKESGGLEPGP